jgi:hypothetical protein
MKRAGARTYNLPNRKRGSADFTTIASQNIDDCHRDSDLYP